jgi:hypothetical protein
MSLTFTNLICGMGRCWENEMLTFEEIEDAMPEGDGCYSCDCGYIKTSAQWLHDFAHAVATKEREVCANRLRATAAHVKDNADALRKYDFRAATDEARCRELAAMYLGEVAERIEWRSNESNGEQP